jgi:hypothetical protein
MKKVLFFVMIAGGSLFFSCKGERQAGKNMAQIYADEGYPGTNGKTRNVFSLLKISCGIQSPESVNILRKNKRCGTDYQFSNWRLCQTGRCGSQFFHG